MEDFEPWAYLYSKGIKDDTGKSVIYLHGLTDDGVEVLLTPAKREKGKEGSFILWKREAVPAVLSPAPKPEVIDEKKR